MFLDNIEISAGWQLILPPPGGMRGGASANFIAAEKKQRPRFPDYCSTKPLLLL